MSRVVVDSSVVIKWFVAEPASAEARRLLDDDQNGVLDFLAPDWLYAEVGNIVWKKQMFQGMSAADARQVLDAFADLTFAVTSSEQLRDDA
ncbi:MAG: type II toxin-antitoxin system VapC family toxin [Planctomycetaceae bacterium]